MISDNMFMLSILLLVLVMCFMAFRFDRYKFKQNKINNSNFELLVDHREMITKQEKKIKTLRDVVVLVGKTQ